MVTRKNPWSVTDHEAIDELQRSTGGVNSPQKDLHMMKVAQAQFSKLGPIEQEKRKQRMRSIMSSLKDIETNLLDYDETYIAPFVCYHLMTTINNLTMLDPDIAYTPSEIGYNEDMSQWWMVYAEKETDDWVRIDIDGETYQLHLTNSNKNAPGTGWTDVSIEDVITMVRHLIRDREAPEFLD